MQFGSGDVRSAVARTLVRAGLFGWLALCAQAAVAERLPARQLRDEVVALRTRLAHAPPAKDEGYAWRERQSIAFSARWRPRVERAAAAGDPFAQWVLHDCYSVPELERAAVDEEPCRQVSSIDIPPPSPELAATGFSGAIALSHADAGLQAIRQRCQGRPQGCQLIEAERELQAQLDVAENEGVLDRIAQYNTLSVCPQLQPNQPRRDDEQHCWRQARLLMTLAALAPRAFSLRLPPGEQKYVASNGYGDLGPVPDPEHNPMAGADAPSRELLEGGLVNPRLSPQQREQLDRYLRNEDAFFTDVWNALERMRVSIDTRLARDPRWQVLLCEHRTYDAAQWRESRSVAHWRKKTVGVPGSIRGEVYMGRYVGQYRGSFPSNGTTEALTVLVDNGSVAGRYLMVYGADMPVRVEVGRIDNCLPASDSELICTYDDRYGFGYLTLLFNADASEFRGNWKPNYHGTYFDRFDAGNWEELKRYWTGKRQ